MHEKLLKGILPKEAPKQKKMSSGVYMSVWQQMPMRPEVQILIHQQQEIEAIKQRMINQEERLIAIEAKMEKLELSYNSLLKTLNLIGSIK